MGEMVIQKIVLSILKFMRQELDSGTLSEDSSESLEVAVQCLESAYNVERSAAQARNVPDLVELFSTSSDIWADEPPVSDQVSDENKAKAEKLKNIGNNLMKEDKFVEAIDNYSRAISLNPNNAVYYCNRAAAHSKLNNHVSAIQDCKNAIRLDPLYSKAYGRLGIAYSSLNKHEDAKKSYLKALELEPDNENYKNNLQLTNEALSRDQVSGDSSAPREDQGAMPPFVPIPGLNLDINSLMNNPALMNMASQMLSNPNMQNIMSGLMSMGQNDSNVDVLLQAGQHLAEQMQNVNPEFVENLRRQMTRDGNPEPPTDPKPPTPDSDDKKSRASGEVSCRT